VNVVVARSRTGEALKNNWSIAQKAVENISQKLQPRPTIDIREGIHSTYNQLTTILRARVRLIMARSYIFKFVFGS
jgi:hypothetical protein